MKYKLAAQELHRSRIPAFLMISGDQAMSFQKFHTTQVTAGAGSYSQGLLAGRTLYLAGQTGEGLDGSSKRPAAISPTS